MNIVLSCLVFVDYAFVCRNYPRRPITDGVLKLGLSVASVCVCPCSDSKTDRAIHARVGRDIVHVRPLASVDHEVKRLKHWLGIYVRLDEEAERWFSVQLHIFPS